MAAWFKKKPRHEPHADAIHFATIKADFNDAEFQLDLLGLEQPDSRAVRRLRCHCPSAFARRFAEVLERQIAAYEKRFGTIRLARTALDESALPAQAPRELNFNTVLVSYTDTELVLSMRCQLTRAGDNPMVIHEVHAFAAMARAPAMLAVLRSALEEHKKKYGAFA
jgi:hypothetical protein